MLTTFYSAQGQSAQTIEVTDVATLIINEKYIARAILPNTTEPQRVVIFQTTLADGSVDLRLVPAACPHQGADISQDPLKADGNVYCSLHRRPICIYSEYNQAFAVAQINDKFFIKQTNQ